MPELPDITVYVQALERRIAEKTLERMQLLSPFVLRSVHPPIETFFGKSARSVCRLGKQIVIEFEADLFLVIHLMIAGRFQWMEGKSRTRGKHLLAALEFSSGTLVLTEAGSKKRASIHAVSGRTNLAAFDRHAVEVFDASLEEFSHALRSENHTLKRALTDPRLFSGIGNAYSDEILHRARLSPLKWTSKLTAEELETLFTAVRSVLSEWVVRLQAETGNAFPSKVTAFHPEMSVHGRFGQPCPICRSAVQRIVYAENECNYCPTCQTGGRLLADRAMSRLLHQDWPRSLDELEKHFDERRKISDSKLPS